MYGFMIVATFIFFVAFVIWCTDDGFNAFIKMVFAGLTVYGSFFLAVAQGISINGHELSALATKPVVIVYYVLVALMSGWLAMLWKRNTWLNMAVHAMWILLCIGSLVSIGFALGVISK